MITNTIVALLPQVRRVARSHRAVRNCPSEFSSRACGSEKFAACCGICAPCR